MLKEVVPLALLSVLLLLLLLGQLLRLLLCEEPRVDLHVMLLNLQTTVEQLFVLMKQLLFLLLLLLLLRLLLLRLGRLTTVKCRLFV